MIQNMLLNYSKIAESFPELTQDICEEILKTYSHKITTLSVICNQVNLSSINPILIDLLIKFGPKLLNLQLYFGTLKCTDSCGNSMLHKLETFHQLFLTLNSAKFPKLKQFTFQYRGLLCDQNYPRIELPILSQLEEFTFECGENVAKSLDLLNRIRNENLYKISLGNRIYFKDNIKFYWLDIPASIATKFVHLEVYQYDCCHCSLLRSMFEMFHNLQTLSLTLSISTFPINQLAVCLIPLKELNYLRLSVNVDSNEPNIETQDLGFKMTSIKVLVLIFNDKGNHEMLSSFGLDKMFPNVQLLRFVLTDNCKGFREIDCVRQLARVFIERWEKLKKVYKRDIVVWQKDC